MKKAKGTTILTIITIIRTTFCPFRTVTKSCPVETVPACPVQIRAHRHIAVYIDSNQPSSRIELH